MHKARTQVKEMLPRVDLFIEVLDARIPYSSENPMLRELRGNKPALKILNKADLADSAVTRQWQDHLEQQRSIRARAVSSKDPDSIRKLAGVCHELFPETKTKITAMIVGVPNIGKSTVINILAGRKIAKTGNEPAVTKGQQRVRIGEGVFLWDTPGMLWPNVENPKSGMRLAATGAVKDTAMDYADVGFFAAAYLLKAYPHGLKERYSLDQIPDDATAFFEEIGRKKGCLGKRGVVDLDRICRIFLTELKAGMLGPVTFETPEMAIREEAETVVSREEKEQKKLRRKQDRRQKFKESRRK